MAELSVKETGRWERVAEIADTVSDPAEV